MKYCTYLHKRPDTGQVFYVGYGSRKRPNHLVGSKRSEEWHKVVLSLGDPIIEVVAFWATKEEAWQHEIFLIKSFRELGHPLVNKSSGGPGASGIVPTEEVRKKLSISNTGKKRTLETRRKISENAKKRGDAGNPMLGKCHTQASKDLMTRNRMGLRPNDETRRKMGDSRRGKTHTPEAKLKIMARLTAYWYRKSVIKLIDRRLIESHPRDVRMALLRLRDDLK